MKVLLATLGIAACTAVGLQQEPALFRAAQLDVGPGSGEILIADLNRDGHPDIVTKHLLHSRITVSLGDGSGKFRRGAGSMELAYQPGAVALGDANGDGNPDLAMASRRDPAEYAEVFLGDGTGRFAKGIQHRVIGAMPYYKPVVQLFDVNEDGKADLVVANGRRNTIQVLAGDGRGGFGAPSSIALEAGHDGYSFAFADVNEDTHLDLVSGYSSEFRGSRGKVIVAFGNGRGHFVKQSELTFESPRLETLADINGDGHVDVILSHATPHLTLLLNDGRGRFAAAGEPLTLPVETHAVVARDFDGDGRVDIAAATENSVTVLLSNGRAFSPAPGSPFRAGPGAFVVAAGALNRDGKPDIAASSFEGNALTLLFGR